MPQDALGIAPQSNLTKTNPDSASFSPAARVHDQPRRGGPTDRKASACSGAPGAAKSASNRATSKRCWMDLTSQPADASSSPQGRRIVDALLSHRRRPRLLKQALGSTGGSASKPQGGKIARTGRCEARQTFVRRRPPHPRRRMGHPEDTPAAVAALWVYARDPLLSTSIEILRSE